MPLITLIKVVKMNFLRKIISYRKRFIDKTLSILNSQSNNSLLDQPVIIAKSFTIFIVCSSGLGILWLGIANTEQIITVKGFLEPKSRLRSVQIPERGIIYELFVKDGDFVSKDQILLRLDNELAQNNFINTKKSIEIQRDILLGKENELKKTLEIYDNNIMTISNSLEIESIILDKYEKLLLEGASSELQYLSQKIKVIELENKLKELFLEKERRSILIKEKSSENLLKLYQLDNKLVEINKIKTVRDIKSPVSGYIFDLKPLGQGYVANSTETILKIVPKDNLIAIISIDTSAIGFVSTGQQVDISIDSFPARDFGSLQGELFQISTSALEPTENNRQFHFEGKVRLSSQVLSLKNGHTLLLKPGMSLTANIKLRKTSYLQLLLGTFKDKAKSLTIL